MDTLSLPQLAEQYMQYCLVIRNYSKATILGYKSTFKLFFEETTLQYPEDLNFRDLEQWFFNGRLNRKWGPVTFRSHLKHLNTFMKWLIKKGYVAENYLNEIEKPRMEHKIPRTLTKEEAQRLLEYSFNMRYMYRSQKYRNRAIIGIMLLAGLRRGEVMRLKLNEVSIEESTIFISQSKGKKDRMIPMCSKLKLILAAYIKERERLKKQCEYFFVSIQKDNPIEERCIQNMITKIRKRTKIYFSAHTLRHAFARLMLEGGCDIYTLSKLMGHSKITTTTIYLSCSNQQMSKSVEMHALN